MVRKKRCARRQGFTLIEVLISITILAFISMAIYQSTARSFELRDSLERESDFYNSVRSAMDVLGRDLASFYTPQLAAFPSALNAPQKNLTNTNDVFDPGLPTMFWGTKLNQAGIRPSRLQGEATKVSFVANNNIRIYQNSQQSDFLGITYSFEDDPFLSKTRTVKALIKRAQTDVFAGEGRDAKDTEVQYTILSGLESVKFRYYDGSKDRWENRWDTTSQDHPNVFPANIELTIEIIPPGGKDKKTFTRIYRLELAGAV